MRQIGREKTWLSFASHFLPFSPSSSDAKRTERESMMLALRERIESIFIEATL
jgi:hypothetical protein